MSQDLLSGDYDHFLHELKERIRNAQVRTALAVNRELILLYWQLGQEISVRQREQGRGAKGINKLAKDLQERRVPEPSVPVKPHTITDSFTGESVTGVHGQGVTNDMGAVRLFYNLINLTARIEESVCMERT